MEWYAKIKWHDGQVAAVPVSKIRTLKPKSLTDFDRNRWYRVKGAAKYYKDGKEHSDYALVGCLAESLEELEKITTRIKFSSAPPPTSDPVSTESEVDSVQPGTSTNEAVASQQKTLAAKKMSQSNAKQDAFKRFISTHSNLDEEDKSDVKALQKKIKQLERENKMLMEVQDKNPMERFEDRLQEMQNRLEINLKSEIKKMKDEITKNVEKKIAEGMEVLQKNSAAVEEMISKSELVKNKSHIQSWIDSLPDDAVSAVSSSESVIVS